MKSHVVTLGDPVVDLCVRVQDQVFRKLNLEAGGCVTLDNTALRQLLEAIPGEITRNAGGSAANVAKGLANLLRGHANVGFAGRLGDDQAGRDYLGEMDAQGVRSLMCHSQGEPSATCLCLVTPDGQRTMRTCLAAASGLSSISQLPLNWLQGCSHLHMEGYTLYRPQLAREAASLARREGASVSLDLASFELVQHCSQPLFELLEQGLVDIIICNQEEATALGKVLSKEKETSYCLEAVQSHLLQYCKVSVISKGAKGCIVKATGEDQMTCSAPAVIVEDTIGAGDFFAAGFLYAYLQGSTWKDCGRIGCRVGSTSVQFPGASLSAEAWAELRSAFSHVSCKAE